MDDKWLRFDAATNPYGPSPKVREAMAAFARTGDFSRYDDEERAESLRGDLAAHWGLHPITSSCTTGLGRPWSGFFWRGCC